MQMNKQGTLSCRNVLSARHESHQSSCTTEGWWLLSKLPECSAPETQMIASRPMCMLSLYTPYPLHQHNVCDITTWHHNHLLPSFSRKNPAHVQESHTGSSVHPSASIPTNQFQCFLHGYAWTISSIPYPKFQACDIYMEMKCIKNNLAYCEPNIKNDSNFTEIFTLN